VSKAHSTFQPADKCPVQPYGDSKNPLIEAGPLPLYRCIPLQSFLWAKTFHFFPWALSTLGPVYLRSVLEVVFLSHLSAFTFLSSWYVFTGRPLHIDHNGIAVTHSRNPNRSASREVACHPARFLAMRSMQTRRIFNDLQWSVFDFWHCAKLAVASLCFWQVIPEAGLIGVEWRMIFDGSLMELQYHEDLVWNLEMLKTWLIWKLQNAIGGVHPTE